MSFQLLYNKTKVVLAQLKTASVVENLKNAKSLQFKLDKFLVHKVSLLCRYAMKLIVYAQTKDGCMAIRTYIYYVSSPFVPGVV